MGGNSMTNKSWSQLKSTIRPQQWIAVAQAYEFDITGKSPNQEGWINGLRVPGTDDSSPDCGVNVHTGFIKDMGGRFEGDFIQFEQDRTGASFGDATDKIAAIIGHVQGSLDVDLKPAQKKPPLLVKSESVTSWNRVLCSRKGKGAKAAWHYLTSRRGLNEESIRQHQIGFHLHDGKAWIVFPFHKLPGGYKVKRFAFDAQAMDWVKDTAGKKVSKTWGGGAALYLLEEAENCTDRVVVCEGEIDTLAAREIGLNALGGSNGAKTFPSEWGRIIANLPGAAQGVCIAFDADQAGRTGAEKAARLISTAGVPVSIADLPEGEDINSMVTAGRVSELKRAIREAALYEDNHVTRAGGDGQAGQVPVIDEGAKVPAFTPEDFKKALEGLEAEAFSDKAYELIDDFAQLPKSEVSKIKRFLTKGGMTARDIQNWQQAVRQTIKEVKAQEPAPREREKNIIALLGDYFLENGHFAVNIGDHLYRYENGVYLPDGKKYISLKMKEVLEEWELIKLWSRYRIDEVVAYIKMQSPELWEAYPYEYQHFINTESGLIDLNTGSIHPHDPHFLSAVQYPIAYNPQATADEWEAFFKTVFPEDAYKAGVHWQLACWALMNTNPADHAVLFTGPGNDGKSRALEAFKNLAGHKNTAHLSLQTLGNNRFAASGIIGKALNICADLPSAHLNDTSLFKQLTGNDVVNGEYKGGAFFSFNNRCKLMFSANKIPSTSDNSEGFFRRWLIIPMNNAGKIQNRIPASELDAKLSAAGELSGVLNQIIAHAPVVIQRGVENVDTSKGAHRDFRTAVDHFGVWVKEKVREVANTTTPHKLFMDSYKEFCEVSGAKPHKPEQVRSLLEERFKATKWVKIPGHKPDYGFKNLTVK